jgi:hypothetical protein
MIFSHRLFFFFYLSLQLEHPAEDVIARGRILGGLEPSRAFGDARYKWPREVQETLRAFAHLILQLTDP